MAHQHARTPGSGRPLGRRLIASVLTPLLGAAFVAVPATVAAAADEPWMDTDLSSDERADLLAAEMTLDQKILLFSPDPQQAIPELGIPGRREIDGGNGISTTVGGTGTTAFPSALALAATWDTDLATAFGAQGGAEAWQTGYVGWAAPAVDMLRNPYSGRQWSSYGEDPVLGGLMPAAVTEGINSNEGVYALPKHWLVNDQETQRRTLNNVVGERALRELYVRQWEPLLEAGPGAVMCAFPQLNGTFACESSYLLNTILKDELSFDGWVSSDFDACYTYDAFPAGADVCGPAFPTQAELKAAVEAGTIASDRFDDMVHRILRTYFERGVIDNPAPGSLINDAPDASPLPDDVVAAGEELAYRIAADSAVLLKNDDAALPLATDQSVALIGEGADRYLAGFGADLVRVPTGLTTVLDGFEGTGADVTYAGGVDTARVGDLMPGLQPIPSSVLTPSEGDGDGLWAEWSLVISPGVVTDPVESRVEDQINWGNGLAALLGTFGSESAPSPKLPTAVLFGGTAASVTWTGSLNPLVSGDYDLGVTVLGEVQVYLDDELVLDEDVAELTTATVPVELEAGAAYDLRVEYESDLETNGLNTDQDLGPAIRLSWTPPVAASSPQIAEAVAAAEAADVAVVIANDYLGESLDRGQLGLPQGQDDLIEAVAAANPRTVVVLTTAGAVEMPWLDDVAGVVEAWYPGQEQGSAIADLLYGARDFSGRLPLSWPASESQVADVLGIEDPWADILETGVDVDHAEGIYVGYRGYERAGAEPLFPFGYGLSYGDGLEYRKIQVKDVRLASAAKDDGKGKPTANKTSSKTKKSTSKAKSASTSTGSAASTSRKSSSSAAQATSRSHSPNVTRDVTALRGSKAASSQASWTFARSSATWATRTAESAAPVAVTQGSALMVPATASSAKAKAGLVRVQVRNSSAQEITETVQVYHGELPADVDTPEHQLLGWSKVTVPAGRTVWVDIPVDPSAATHVLSYWDETGGAWVTPKGSTSIEAGPSLGDLRLEDEITVS